MDKCTGQAEVGNAGSPAFNALDIMKEGAVKKKEGGSVSDSDQNAKLNAIGDTWLDENGNVVLQFRRTSDGIPVHSLKTYKAGTKQYDEVLKHVGGLKPGETKLVQPWPD